MDGNLNGEIKFNPFFSFNINIDLNSMNFSRFHTLLLKMNEDRRKSLFKINNKINGKLGISVDKVYSKYNLVRSLESRLNFINGDIIVEQLLFNLGKLGAADINGSVINDKEFTNFKFENNIFIDNQKYFFNKFSIYNKKDVLTNLFTSGNFDLVNLNIHLYEVSGNEKFKSEDINYIEREFNNILLENGYESFFDFRKFKEFIKLMMEE